MKEDFDSTIKHISRYEDPLWCEKLEEQKHRLVSVKRFSSNNFKKNCWKVFDNKKQTMLIDGESLNDKAVNFLFKPEGICFVIKAYKEGKSEQEITDLLNQI